MGYHRVMVIEFVINLYKCT